MKDGVILINTSRGGLINEDDLVNALNSGKIYAAGLDVISEEPPRHDLGILHCENATITDHIDPCQRHQDCVQFRLPYLISRHISTAVLQV